MLNGDFDGTEPLEPAIVEDTIDEYSVWRLCSEAGRWTFPVLHHDPMIATASSAVIT